MVDKKNTDSKPPYIYPEESIVRENIEKWQDMKFGMFIHWGLYSIPACGEWMMSQKEMTIEEYSKYFDQFDPVDYDPKKWQKKQA